jgi:hypothetical protein
MVRKWLIKNGICADILTLLRQLFDYFYSIDFV